MIAARTLRPVAAATLLWLVVVSSPLQADATRVAWDPLRTSSPETVDELKALQNRVKEVIEKARPSTVGLLIGAGAGSGVIVSEDGIVLTAAHVIGKPGQPVRFVLSDGSVVRGKSLGSNPKYDSGMARITDKPPKTATWPGAEEGKWPAAELGTLPRYEGDKLVNKGQWVVALGHPGGPKMDRPPPVRVGRFQNHLKHDNSLRSDCTLVGGDSGGPLFDLNGKVVGIHSRIGLFLEYNMHVPTELYQDEWAKMLKSEVIGRPSNVELGLVLDEDEEAPTVKKVLEGGPAEKSGIQVGDVITRFDGERVHFSDDLVQILNGMEPGQIVMIEIQRGDETKRIRLTLGSKAKKDQKKQKKDDE
jgi:serine protease Do